MVTYVIPNTLQGRTTGGGGSGATISNISVTEITSSSVRVNWTTDVPTVGFVNFSSTKFSNFKTGNGYTSGESDSDPYMSPKTNHEAL